MSTTYNGQAGNVTYPAQLTLQSVISVGPPTVLQTSTDHGLAIGDLVDLKNVPDAALNGIFAVVGVPTTSQFSINATAGGTGTFSAGVHCQPIKFVATVTQPSDGDAADAASVDTPFGGEADRGVALLSNTGAYKVAQIVPPSTSGWNNDSGNSPLSAWQTCAVSAGSTWQAVGGSTVFEIDNVVAGDLVSFELTTSLQVNPATHEVAVKLYSGSYTPGGSPSYAAVTGSAQIAFIDSLSAPGASPLALKGLIPVTTSGVMKIALWCWAQSTSDLVELVGDMAASAVVYRPTGVPQ